MSSSSNYTSELVVVVVTLGWVCCLGWPTSLRSSAASSGPALVGVVRKDWATQNSIALSWSQVEPPPSDIVDYEVKYYEKVRSYTMQNKLVSPHLCTICVRWLVVKVICITVFFNNKMHRKWSHSQRTITAHRAMCAVSIQNHKCAPLSIIYCSLCCVHHLLS